MVIIKSPREVELIHQAGLVINEVFKQLETFIKPGLPLIKDCLSGPTFLK